MLPLFGEGNLQYLAATKIAAGWLNRVKKIKLQSIPLLFVIVQTSDRKVHIIFKVQAAVWVPVLFTAPPHSPRFF